MRTNLLVAALWLGGCAVEVERAPSSSARRDAVVGGTEDDGGAYPASFYLRSDWSTGGPTACSSTLITSRTLLTAAHCVDIRKVSGATSVNVFANNISPHPASADPSWVQVGAISIHPSYNPGDFRDPFDVALVLLPQASTVAPIPFNARDLSTGFTGLPITVVGWGLTSSSAMDQGTRRFTALTMRSISATHILLGDMTGKGICNGDSGGPSLHQFADGITRVVGVHSYTEPGGNCMDGADVRVDKLASFISQYIMTNQGPTCGEDGLCKAGCTPADIDCSCKADGVCSAACPNLLSDPDCPPDCVANGVCSTADCPVPDPDCSAELASCTSAVQCQYRQCVSDPQHNDKYCSRTCSPTVGCPTGTSCTTGVCTRDQLPEGSLGTDCTVGVTLCLDSGVCSGPPDAGTYCAPPCATEAMCGDTAHCVDGSHGRFCQPAERRLPVLGVSGGDAKAGCASAPGLLAASALLFSTALRRRKGGRP